MEQDLPDAYAKQATDTPEEADEQTAPDNGSGLMAGAVPERVDEAERDRHRRAETRSLEERPSQRAGVVGQMVRHETTGCPSGERRPGAAQGTVVDEEFEGHCRAHSARHPRPNPRS